MDYITVEEFQPFGDPSLQIAGDSNPPYTPDKPQGPTTGRANHSYTYNTSTTDDDSDVLYFLFDWNDSGYSGWIGPYAPGELAAAQHNWTSPGTYHIRARAKDDQGVQSNWSEPLIVDIEPAAIEIRNVSGGIGVTAEIYVFDFIPDESIQWSIELDKAIVLLPLKRSKEGSFPTPRPGTSKTIYAFVFGLGMPDINIQAQNASFSTKGFLFGPLIFL
jgi:hypothetical protein